MKKTLAALAAAALAVALPVLATTTWTEVTTDSAGKALPSRARCVRGTYTTTTEAAPSAATAGFDLTGVGGLSLEAESLGTLTAGGKYLAYLYNPLTGNWAPVSDGSLDLIASAVGKQAWSGFTVTEDYGRVAFEPSGIGSGSTLYICGTAKK